MRFWKTMGLAALAGLAITSAPAYAIPSTLSLQGYLTNAGGSTQDGNYSFTVTLWTAETNGTSLYTQAFSNVAVKNGLFDVILNDTALTSDLFKNNNAVWMQVKLDSGPGVLANEAPLPRQQLTASPFSFAAQFATSATSATTANTAATANGLVCSNGCVSVTELDFDPATQAELAAALQNLVTNASLATTLADYALSSSLSGYATTAQLSGYVTTSALTTTLNGYVQSSALSNYVTSSALTTALANYATTASLSGYVTSSALTTALQNYATTSALSAYATTASLANYATTASLSAYVKTADLTTTLAAYAKTTDLAAYAKTSDLPTDVDGLGGGSITSGVSVAGALSATSITQGGKGVCDTSGNCGATLPTGCSATQVPQFDGTTWKCVSGGGGGTVPSAPCNGVGQAVQWDGTAWKCITVRNIGPSGGEANGSEVRDDWGDTWDGLQRAPRTWSQAKAACEADGGRLPTITELWRNRSNLGGSGNLGDNNATNYLWTLIPRNDAPRTTAGVPELVYMTVRLSDGSIGASWDTNGPTDPVMFRCIWPKQTTNTAFEGNFCHGPAGTECQSKDINYNVDSWSRPAVTLVSAQYECEFYNATLLNTREYTTLIQSGYGWNPTNLYKDDWHWLGDTYNYNDTGSSLINWDSTPEPHWGPDYSNGYGNEGSYGTTGTYAFRCIGKKKSTFGNAPATTPACNGGCFLTTQRGRARVWADSTDRGAQQWKNAFETCRLLGGTLPRSYEVQALLHSGWSSGSNAWLWMATPTWKGFQLFRWNGVGNKRWSFAGNSLPDGQQTGSSSGTDATTYAYRCVWHETEEATFRSCPVGQVEMRALDGVGYRCVASTNGNSNGQANPGGNQFVDAWGNAWDFIERSAKTYPNAKAECESAGGRLPVATELYRVRYQNGVVSGELGFAGSTSWLWTLNPEYRPNFRVVVRLDNGTSGNYDGSSAQTSPFRCVWPATKPELFSGHACYGPPTAPCFETGRIRADVRLRVALPHPSAEWECRFFGGWLPDMRQQAELAHGGMKFGASGVYEWSSDFQHMSPYTYINTPSFPEASGTQWQYGSTDSGNYDSETTLRPFRCAFSDKLD